MSEFDRYLAELSGFQCSLIVTGLKLLSTQLKRFSYSIKKNHQSAADPENPDTRPLSLYSPYNSPAPIVKPKSENRHSYKAFNFELPPPLPPLGTYSPPSFPEERNNPIIGFIKASKTYNKKSLRTLKNDNVLDKPMVSSQLESQAFVRDYILEKTQDVEAAIIQNAWKLYKKKSRFKKFIAFHIDYNRATLKVMMLAWRLSHEIEPKVLMRLFIEFSKTYQIYSKRIIKKRDLSPFGLFYINSRLFLPREFTAEQIYRFVYLMSSYMMGRIIRLWCYLTKKRKQHRYSLKFIRFTSKKISNFGPIFSLFNLWSRYTKWKHLQKTDVEQNLKQQYISLQLPEVNIRWNIIENRLNNKRSRIARANIYSAKRIASKTARALYNRSIECIAKDTVIQNADCFRNLHLQNLTHRGWLKYMQMRSQEKQIQSDMMKAWYSHIYEVKYQRLLFELATRQYLHEKFLKIMNGWYKCVRKEEIHALRKKLITQSNPSVMLAIIFLLRGNYELFYSTLCFRGWIRFMRARRRWYNFSRWSESPNDDQETQHRILTELKRASVLKLAQRLYVGQSPFFPRRVGFSLELTLREIHEEKEREIVEAKNHWRFETDFGNSKSTKPDFTGDTLIRLILVGLYQVKNYELCRFNGKKQEQNAANPFFERVRTLEEFRHAANHNTNILRERISYKLNRDQAILDGMVSHIAANNYSTNNPQFSTTETYLFVSNKNRDNESDIMKQKLIIFPDILETYHELSKQAAVLGPRIPSKFEEEREEAFNKFSRRLRDPSTLNTTTLLTKFNENTLSDVSHGSGPRKNPLINSYTPPKSKVAMMMQSVGISAKSTDVSNKFDVAGLKFVLGLVTNFDDMMNIFKKFFGSFCSITLKIPEPVLLSSPNDIAPNAEQSKRHAMFGNIANFLAESAGFVDLSQIPKRIDAPKAATDAVSAVLTLHTALINTNLSQYLEVIPFSQKLKIGDPIVIKTRNRIWTGAQAIDNKLEFPVGQNNLVHVFNSLNKFRQMTSTTNMFSSSNSSFDLENLSNIDVFFCCYMLPFVFSFDMISDFVKDEFRNHHAARNF